MEQQFQLANSNAHHTACGSVQHKPRQILKFGAICKNCNKLHHFHKSLPALSFYGMHFKMAKTVLVKKNNFGMWQVLYQKIVPLSSILCLVKEKLPLDMKQQLKAKHKNELKGGVWCLWACLFVCLFLLFFLVGMILGNPKRGARKTYSDSQRECHLVVLSTIRHGACFTVAPLTPAGFLFIFFSPYPLHCKNYNWKLFI